MSLFGFSRQPDINQGVTQYQNTPGAILLDVRTPQEYREGHIPASHNVPLQDLESVAFVAEDPDAPLFVYCHSGARSRQATLLLQQMGYTKVYNIGGITAYTGTVEK